MNDTWHCTQVTPATDGQVPILCTLFSREEAAAAEVLTPVLGVFSNTSHQPCDGRCHTPPCCPPSHELVDHACPGHLSWLSLVRSGQLLHMGERKETLSSSAEHEGMFYVALV